MRTLILALLLAAAPAVAKEDHYLYAASPGMHHIHTEIVVGGCRLPGFFGSPAGLKGRSVRSSLDFPAVGNAEGLPAAFVVPKGGVYFFVPSLRALRTELSNP